MQIKPLMTTIGKTKVYVSEAGKEANEALVDKLKQMGNFQNSGRYTEVKVRDGVASLTERFLENHNTTRTTHYVKLKENGTLETIGSKSRYHCNPSVNDQRQIDALWTANPATGYATSHNVTLVNGKKTEEISKKMFNKGSSDCFYSLGEKDYSNLVKDYNNGVYSKAISDPTGKRGVAVEFGTIDKVDGKEVLTKQKGGIIHPVLGKVGDFDETLQAMQRYSNTTGYPFINGMNGYTGQTINKLS